MINLNKHFLCGLFSTFLSCGFALAVDQDVLVTSAELQDLRASGGHKLSSEPVRVDVLMGRSDGLYEIIYDFYLKKDEDLPITTEEIFNNFKRTDLLPILLDDPISSLSITIEAHIAEDENSICKNLIMDKPQFHPLLGNIQ